MATTTASAKSRAAKTYIDVAYKDRDLAKRLGARWDASAKRWYCPSGSTLALIYKWRKAPTPAEVGTVNARIDRDLGALDAVAADTLVPAAAPEPAAPRTRISRVERKRPHSMRPVAANTPAFDFDGNLELPLAG